MAGNISAHDVDFDVVRDREQDTTASLVPFIRSVRWPTKGRLGRQTNSTWLTACCRIQAWRCPGRHERYMFASYGPRSIVNPSSKSCVGILQTETQVAVKNALRNFGATGTTTVRMYLPVCALRATMDRDEDLLIATYMSPYLVDEKSPLDQELLRG